MGKEIFSDEYSIDKDGKFYIAKISIELVESVSIKKDPIGEPIQRLEKIDPLRKRVRSMMSHIIGKKAQ